MDTLLIIIAGTLFVLSLGAHIYVKLCMRPEKDTDREDYYEDYYYEVEEADPVLARYNKWSRVTFAAAVIAALMLFIAVMV